MTSEWLSMNHRQPVSPIGAIDNTESSAHASAVLVYGWRSKIMELLANPIDPEATDVFQPEEGTKILDPDKEYYAEALKAQGDGMFDPPLIEPPFRLSRII
jgi:hypothetical protein